MNIFMSKKNKHIKIFTIVSILFFIFSVQTVQASTTIKNLTKGLSSLGLMAYWPLDGAGVSITNLTNTGTAADTSGNGRTLTLSGGDWHEETSPILGKVAQGLFFNGGNETTAGNFANSLSEMTVSAWFKTEIDPGTVACLICKMDDVANAGWAFILRSDGYVSFGTQDSGPTNYHYKYVSTDVTDGKWHHVVATLTGGINGTIALYIDGVAQSLTDNTSGTVASNSTTDPVRVGYGAGAMEGNMDEPRIYNRALSATEVLAMYNLGSSKKNMTPKKVISNSGLVGYWPFDGRNTVWSSATAASATDVSGYGHTGSSVNMNIATALTTGKLGQALRFDGSNRISATHSSALATNTDTVTIAAWVKRTASNTTGTILNHGQAFASGFRLTIGRYLCTTNQIEFEKNNVSMECLDSFPADTKWHHFVMVADSSGEYLYIDGVLTDSNSDSNVMIATASNVFIGRDDSSAGFDGSIDDVRYYNRALSTTEISALYAQGAANKVNVTKNKIASSGLVGYWPFDGKYISWGGPTALDATGNGNSGTITNMTQNIASVIGKSGQALLFDGSNDSVDIVDSASLDLSVGSKYSWSFWLKPTSFGDLKNSYATYDGGAANFLTISTHTTADTNYGACTKCVSVAWANTAGSNYLIAHTSDNVLVANKWTHVLITYDGTLSQASRFKIYAGGVDVTNNGDIYSTGTTTSISPSITEIGGEPGAHAAGAIDEFRFYNKLLSTGEIAELARP